MGSRFWRTKNSFKTEDGWLSHLCWSATFATADMEATNSFGYLELTKFFSHVSSLNCYLSSFCIW